MIDDAAPNTLAFGRDARRGCIVATTGLIATLDRMQLEAVVADLLVSLRDGLTATPTVAPRSARGGRRSGPRRARRTARR